MMKNTLTVAAGWIAGSVLALVAAPAMAHGNGDIGYGAPDVYAPAPSMHAQPGPAHGRYRDRSRYDRWHGIPFAASVTRAPTEDATVRGLVRLEVRGSGLANVELLPASGYTPKLGVFHISADRTFAWLDFDTTRLAQGELHVRISAFDVPAGQPGASEILAMPARQWILR